MTTAFKGKTAIVTGAAGGMGAEITARLVDGGAAVLGVDRDESRLKDLAARLGASSGRLVTEECDISDPEAVRRSATRFLAEAGAVHFLINAAGLVNDTRPLETITDEEWNALMGVNVNGAFYWMRETLPAMKAQRFGKIVNVSSRAGRTMGNFAGAHYSASKAALLGLTRQAAYESAPYNVYVNAIAPGLVDTPMLRGIIDEDRIEGARAVTPLRRIGTAGDIAELALFLLSPQSDFITGATVDINGGDLIL